MNFKVPATQTSRLPVTAPVALRCLAAVLTASFVASGQSTGSEADVQSIRDLIARYTRSIDTADTTLAAEIWSASPDVSFIHPLGHAHGFDQVKQTVYVQLMGGLFSERKLSAKDATIHVYGDAAWAEFYWDFVAKLRKDGSTVTTHGRETQIYHKEQDRWRLVHVHYSGMPVTGAGQGF
jgi:ketosteroid isomerase-like protein